MTDISQPQRKKRDLQRKHRVRLREGQHVEKEDPMNPLSKDIVYSRGDVFLSIRPLWKRDQNKYEAVPEYTPLIGGQRIMGADFDPDFDEEDTSSTVPTVPLQRPPQEQNPPAPQVSRKQEAFDDNMLKNMTVAELKSLAEAEEIPLEGATSKNEIVAAIKKNRG